MNEKSSVMETSAMPRLLKVTEVAALLNISRSSAYLLLENGQLSSVRIGSMVRVRPEDLVAFIEANIKLAKLV